MAVHLDVLQHVVRHLQALVHQLQGGEEDVLEQLPVTVVAVGHVAAQQGDLVLAGQDPVALAAQDLPHVGVLLVRHDAGARGQLVREVDEAEVGAHVHAAVGSEFIERQRNAAYRGSDGTLGAAPLHLCGDAVVDGGVEAQKISRHLPVQGEGIAVARRRAERIAVDDPVGSAEGVHVVHQRLGIGAEPEAEGRRHGHLRVRVAGQQRLLVLFTQHLEIAEQGEHLAADRLQLVPQEELQVHEHLVVARASGVDLLAHFTQLAGEQQLHLRMDVLDVVFQGEIPGCDALGDASEGGVQRGVFLRAEQPDLLKHLDVRAGALHVVACQPEVEHPVVADRETIDGLCRRSSFIPKRCHRRSQ